MSETVKAITAGTVSSVMPYLIIAGGITVFLLWYRDPISKSMKDISEGVEDVVEDAANLAESALHVIIPATDPATIAGIRAFAVEYTEFKSSSGEIIRIRDYPKFEAMIESGEIPEPTEEEMAIYGGWQAHQEQMQAMIDAARFQGY